jgi:hypothetical protein
MIQELAILTAVIAVGFFLAVGFYESMATRDVLLTQTAAFTRRITRNPAALAVTHGLTVLVAIPILVVVWALVLEAALAIVVSPDNTQTAETAIATVAAARLLAYVRQKTSHELAKAIPLALALSLLLGGLPRIEDNLEIITAERYQSDLTITMLVFLLALEAGLRVLSDLVTAAAAMIRRIKPKDATDGEPAEATEVEHPASTPQA